MLGWYWEVPERERELMEEAMKEKHRKSIQIGRNYRCTMVQNSLMMTHQLINFPPDLRGSA